MTKSSKHKEILFVADMVRGQLPGAGGAENNDDVLLMHLAGQEDLHVSFEHCSQLTQETLDKADFVIVGNFVSLSDSMKASIQKKPFLIYEHDHKYLRTRDPSPFKDFVAPRNQIINEEFYQNASAVVVLSEVCREVIQKNLRIDEVHSIGTSLWSDEQLDFLGSLSENEKINETAIIDSSNSIKGRAEAIKHCATSGIEYTLIQTKAREEFWQELSLYKRLVFMPQVLETFSRLCAEAKMVGCKLVTKPRLLGFASESSWTLSGKDLVEETRARVHKALQLFDALVREEKPEVNTGDGEITVILNAYRRPDILEEQIEAIRNQSVKVKDIWVWINRSEATFSEEWLAELGVKYFQSNFNWKFYGRFAAAMLADTEFVAMFDDDTIPGKEWLSNCVQTMNETPGILGGVGCILPGERYTGHHRVGWSNPNEETTEVDLVGHAWFFKSEWLKYLWMEKPYTWENGEDIQFSYTAQKYGGIKTYVAPHPKDKPELYSSLKGMEYGVDEVATSRARNHDVFYAQRDACVRNAIKNGWKIVKER